MSLSLTVFEILEALSSCLQSIDIRNVLVKNDPDDLKWIHLLTIIRFSCESREKRRSQTIPGIYEAPITTPQFKITRDVYPFVEWKDLIENFKKEEFTYAGDTILCPRQHDLSISTYIGASTGFPDTIGNEWPRATYTYGHFAAEKLEPKPFFRAAATYKAPDPHTLIANLLEIKLIRFQPIGSDLYIDIPVPIRVSKPSFLSNPDRIAFSVKGHQTLQLEIIAETELKDSPGTTVRSRIQLSKASEEEEGKYVDTQYTTAFPDTPRLALHIQALHPELGVITSTREDVDSLQPIEYANPLLAVLQRFCREDDVKALILNPEVKAGYRTTSGALFELRIAWLFASLGFSCIVTGNYEKLVAPQTRHEYGSVDILAAFGKARIVFLIACTLDVAKQDDRDRLINVADVVRREVFADVDVQVQPILVTGAVTGGQEIDHFNVPTGLIVIDRRGLEQLWSAAHQADRDMYLYWLGIRQYRQ